MSYVARILLACLVAAGASSIAAAGRTQTTPSTAIMTTTAQAAWARVRQAQTPPQQAAEVRGFLAVLATGNGRRIIPALDARDIASGRAVSLDDPVLVQRPQAHEVTVAVAGQFLVFRPLSRASLDPFLGR
ncbi:hypothetical protein [Brevundimonas sp.]|jgi:hypothetical protein|uniref:hypothetical protein n=1 Tax=Brevundimonas sp. TaxID=1871086 RepID=UPI0037C15DE4